MYTISSEHPGELGLVEGCGWVGRGGVGYGGHGFVGEAG